MFYHLRLDHILWFFLFLWFLIYSDLLFKLGLAKAILSSFCKQDKKDEEAGTSGNPYKNLEKASVLQEVNYLSFVSFDEKKLDLKYSNFNKNYLYDQSSMNKLNHFFCWRILFYRCLQLEMVKRKLFSEDFVLLFRFIVLYRKKINLNPVI